MTFGLPLQLGAMDVAAAGALDIAKNATVGVTQALALDAVPTTLDVMHDSRMAPHELDGTLDWIARGEHVIKMANKAHMSPAMTRPLLRTLLGAVDLYQDAAAAKADYDSHHLSLGAVRWLMGNFTKQLSVKQHDIDDQINIVQNYPFHRLRPFPRATVREQRKHAKQLGDAVAGAR